MSAPSGCSACGWFPRFRRLRAARAAVRRHRCLPKPVRARGCRLADLQADL